MAETCITFTDGFEFTGTWKDGQIHGKGAAKYANGDLYEGEFREGKRHGFGTMKYATGAEYKGYWVNGKRGTKEESEIKITTPPTKTP